MLYNSPSEKSALGTTCDVLNMLGLDLCPSGWLDTAESQQLPAPGELASMQVTPVGELNLI